MDFGCEVWQVDGFDLGSIQVADRPLYMGGEVHELVYILVDDDALHERVP